MRKFDPEGEQSTSEYKNRKEESSRMLKLFKKWRKQFLCACGTTQEDCGKDPINMDYGVFGENDESSKNEQKVDEDIP